MKRDKLKKIARAIHRHNKKRHNPTVKNVSPLGDKQEPRTFRIGVNRIGRNAVIGGNK
jgi:hypothetical protein